MARQAAAGVVWLALQSVAGRVAILLSQIALARLLLPADFGTVALASTITTIAGVLVGFGVDDVLLQRQKNLRLWEGPAFWINMGFALIGAVLVMAIAPFGAAAYRDPKLVGVLAVLALSMPLNALTTLSSVKMRAALSFRTLAVFGTAEAVGVQLLTIALALLNFGVYSFVLPTPLVAVIRTAAMWNITGPPRILVGRQVRRRQWLILLSRSTAVFGSKLLTGIISQADYIILGLLSTSYSVGLYFFAFRLSSQSLRLLAGNLNSVLFPTLNQLNTNAPRQTYAALRAARMLAFLAMPLCFLQGALADPIMSKLFAETWRPSIRLVEILSLGFPFDAPAWVAGALLTARGEFRRAFVYSVVGGVSFVGLIAAGSYLGDAVGVATAVSIYYLFYGPAYIFAVLRRAEGIGRFMADSFLVAPLLSALAFGIPTLAADNLLDRADHLFRATVIFAVGLPLYALALRLACPALFVELTGQVRALLSKIRRPELGRVSSV